MKDHADAIRAVINILIDKEWGVIESMSEIDAVGHRVVHGGEYFADSVLINDEVIKAIEACVPPGSAAQHGKPDRYQRVQGRYGREYPAGSCI